MDTRYLMPILELPAKIKIDSVTWEVGAMVHKLKVAVPTNLKPLCVTVARQTYAAIQYGGSFVDMSREKMIKTINEVCKTIGDYSVSDVRVLYCVLSCGDTSARYQAQRKLWNVGAAKPTKSTVLTMQSHNGGKDLYELIALTGAKKVVCTIGNSRIVICQVV
jgi:hypothetical protein